MNDIRGLNKYALDTIHHGFDRYQDFALTTVVNDKKKDLTYCALGVADEAGEVAGKVKKLIRDHDGVLTPELAKAIAKEEGDVLWSLAILSARLGVSFGDVALMNIEKLQDRKARGVLQGSGDNR